MDQIQTLSKNFETLILFMSSFWREQIFNSKEYLFSHFQFSNLSFLLLKTNFLVKRITEEKKKKSVFLHTSNKETRLFRIVASLFLKPALLYRLHQTEKNLVWENQTFPSHQSLLRLEFLLDLPLPKQKTASYSLWLCLP